MIDEERINSVIYKILRESTEGIIKWSLSNHKINGLDGDEELIGHVYKTGISNKNIRLYKYKAKYYVDEDEFHWVSRIRLEFYSTYSNAPEWSFPYSNALDNLYDIVMAQTANIDDFFNEYLS